MRLTPSPMLAYTRCPTCELVGPPEFIVCDGDGTEPLTLRAPFWLSCVRCHTDREVPSLADVIEPDAFVWHSCGMTFPAPAIAHAVRCGGRGPDGRETGCGSIIDGPALGAPAEPAAPAPVIGRSRPAVAEPDPWAAFRDGAG